MAKEDQDVRTQASRRNEVGQVDDQNNAPLKEIIAAHGWPGVMLVGFEGSQSMWLMVQHQDKDLEFQKECLYRS